LDYINFPFLHELSQKGMRYLLIALVGVAVLSLSYFMDFLWLAISMVSALGFFYFSYRIISRWAVLPWEIFRKKLFWTALILRVVVVVFLYGLFHLLYGNAFEFKSADAGFYDYSGRTLSALFRTGILDLSAVSVFADISDMGYPVVLGFFYTFLFDSVLMSRMVHAVLGAMTCVWIYDLARRNFGESVGRISGVLMMLMPNLLYYTGLTLKETVMVFILVAYTNLGDLVLKSPQVKGKYILGFLALGLSLYFFRVVLFASSILAFVTALLISSKVISGVYRRVTLLVWLGIAIIGLGQFDENLVEGVNTYWEASGSNLDDQMSNFTNREGGNRLAAYGSRAVFLPLMISAPFPSFVDTGQEQLTLLAGAYFTRNIYGFFVFVALVWLIRTGYWRMHVLLLALAGGYLFVLASSGFALSERFHLPILPFLCILTAVGIQASTPKTLYWFKVYLVLILLIILGWNWFKLAGRGLI
jgi:hypothetical protein